MTGRVEVTSLTVKRYLDQIINRDNYYFLYSLHFLSREDFVLILDLLLNNELRIEDLIKLNDFSPLSVRTLIQENHGNWTNSAVREPNVALNGYEYLVNTLGLTTLIQSALTPSFGNPIAKLLETEIYIGDNGHSDLEEVDRIFRNRVLPEALNGLALRVYLPESIRDTLAFPLMNSDQVDLIDHWGTPLLEPIIGVDTGVLITRLITAGVTQSNLRKSPGLSEWLYTMSRPSPDVILQIHREAVERTKFGRYTRDEIDACLDDYMSYQVDFIATSHKMSILDTKLQIMKQAILIEFPDDEELNLKYSMINTVLETLFGFRNRFRVFLDRILIGCSENLIGYYPIHKF
jgi:hypothetical protein